MIYKNKDHELWCECGNRVHESGFSHFHTDPHEGTNCEGFCKQNNWRCEKCLNTINFDKAKLKETPEDIKASQQLQEKLEKLKKLLETLKGTERYYKETYLDSYRENYENAMLQREAVETQIEVIEIRLKNN